MGRKSRVLGFSVAPEIADEYEQLAESQRKTKSELFRQMVETYKARLEEEEFFRGFPYRAVDELQSSFDPELTHRDQLKYRLLLCRSVPGSEAGGRVS